ncbi:Mu transposase domain-containing protein [Mangrovicoccus ximenensis]|uniref:Mu transposase domain-containing protein n=1 Tax=Mangrovicoccus ximenensis TaxID=1911570 RepID=UPI000D367715|nr:hypothetical protein [Mangrovicoccus ximenensis]
MKCLREIVLIHDLKRQGLSVTAIALKLGCDRKTVRKYLKQGLEAPVHKTREPVQNLLEPFEAYLRDRVGLFPDLSGRRLLREIRAMGYKGSYSTLKPFLRSVRPSRRTQFERRFETPPGKQAQVDFAEFTAEFTDEPGVVRPALAYDAVLTVERRVSKEGMVSVGGNLYSVPDTARRRVLEVQHHTAEIRIFEDGQLIARHPVLEGKALRRVDPAHRKAPPPRPPQQMPVQGLRRPLDFYDAVGRRLAAGSQP